MYKIVSTGLVLAFEAKLYFDKNQKLKFKTGCCCYFFFIITPWQYLMYGLIPRCVKSCFENNYLERSQHSQNLIIMLLRR